MSALATLKECQLMEIGIGASANLVAVATGSKPLTIGCNVV